MLSLRTNDRCGSPNHPLECQMSKRKPATASKHAHSTKIAAQQANQAIIRGPKDSPLRSVAAGSTEPLPEGHNESKQRAPLLKKPECAPRVEKPATTSQDDCKQTMTDNDSTKGACVFFNPRQARAYQAKLLKWHKPTCNWLFEFAQRLATDYRPLKCSASLQNSQASGSPCNEVFDRNG